MSIKCPGPFSANTCNFSFMISFWIYPDDPTEILSKLSFIRLVVLLLLAHTSKFRHILKMAILLFFYFSRSLSLVYSCWLCTRPFLLLSSSLTGNSLTVLINTSFSSCSCFSTAITVSSNNSALSGISLERPSACAIFLDGIYCILKL